MYETPLGSQKTSLITYRRVKPFQTHPKLLSSNPYRGLHKFSFVTSVAQWEDCQAVKRDGGVRVSSEAAYSV